MWNSQNEWKFRLRKVLSLHLVMIYSLGRLTWCCPPCLPACRCWAGWDVSPLGWRPAWCCQWGRWTGLMSGWSWWRWILKYSHGWYLTQLSRKLSKLKAHAYNKRCFIRIHNSLLYFTSCALWIFMNTLY